MDSPTYEYHWVGFRVVWREARSPEPLTRRELFPNFLRMNLEEAPAGSGRYVRRMLRHLVTDPQTQCLPLILVWFTKDVGDLQMSSDKLGYGRCVVPIYQHPVLAHLLPNCYAAEADR